MGGAAKRCRATWRSTAGRSTECRARGASGQSAGPRVTWPIWPVLAIALSGCVSSVRVHDVAGERLKGIPFYVKTSVFEQKSVWKRHWFKGSLTEKETWRYFDGTKAPKSHVITKPALQARVGKTQESRIADLRRALAGLGGGGSPDSVRSAFLSLSKLPLTPYDLEPELYSNQVVETTAVDYDRVLFLNAPVPWFGESKLTSELNADGTLSKASTEVTSEPGDALSTLLPIKEFLTAELIDDDASAEEVEAATLDSDVDTVGPATKAISFELSVEEQGFLYVFSLTHAVPPLESSGDCPAGSVCKLQPIPFDLERGKYVQSPLGTAPPKKPSNGISFSGQIVLPKSGSG